MEPGKAKEIVTLLANGTDPETGEVYPSDSPYNNPMVIRALFELLNNTEAKGKQGKLSIEDKRAQNIASGRPRNAGLPWTDEQKQDLVTMFKGGKSASELAPVFERTEGALLAELERQGVIDKNDSKYRR